MNLNTNICFIITILNLPHYLYTCSSINRVASDSIKAGEAVWFGCEVNKRFAGKLGLEDLKMFAFYLFLCCLKFTSPF